MHQTTHFFNLGYGWLCKHCSAEDAERKHLVHHPDKYETKSLPLARWIDEKHNSLHCPRCGIEEELRRKFH